MEPLRDELSYSTITDAEDVRLQLIEDLDMINAQLSDGCPPDKSQIEYQAWRKQALFARAHKLSQLRRVKAWIARECQGKSAERHVIDRGLNPDEPITILWALYHVAKRQAFEREWMIPKEDRDVLDAAQWYLRKELGAEAV